MGRRYVRIVAAFVLFMANTLTSASGTATKDIFPMRQGVHESVVPQGKLNLIVGTYQDSTTFSRTYSFYLVPKGDTDWLQVPFIRKGDHVDFSISSASVGDTLLADGVLVKRGEIPYFVHATKKTAAGSEDPGITVTWFRFVEADGAETDRPAFYWKPVFSRLYKKTSTLSVESVLLRETTLNPEK